VQRDGLADVFILHGNEGEAGGIRILESVNGIVAIERGVQVTSGEFKAVIAVLI
jgi:hypothetical protein